MDPVVLFNRLKGHSLLEILELALVGLELKEEKAKEEIRLSNARVEIKRILRSQGLTVQELAERSNMSYPALERFVNGSLHPTHAWKVDLCVILQRTYKDLWELDN